MVHSDPDLILHNSSVLIDKEPHCHCHLIPRYQGDVEEPKGGVRGVIPDKQAY
ncbi:hypothetical protein IGJ15_001965 [Enterococcus sp. AZ079]